MKKTMITKKMLEDFGKEFKNNPQRELLANAVINNGIANVAMNYKSKIKMQYSFSEELKTGEITHQKSSGRCWIFAGLNVLRQRVAKRFKIKDCELSQNHTMFWDKLEKANYFLENIIETKDEGLDSRLVMWLLSAPLQDGGQWDMFANLVEKYGVVPKSIMPETFHSSNTYIMNKLLTIKLREFAIQLRELPPKTTAPKIKALKNKQINEFYKMLVHFLGEPPKKFNFEYSDDNKNYHIEKDLTPQKFFENYVNINLDDYVSLINAPTADKPFNKTYTVKYLGNVIGGKKVLYLNIDAETMKELAARQIKDKEPVWFGCDVGQMMDKDSGIMDMDLYNFFQVLDTTITMTKAQRLDYGESRLTHAMVFTGVNLVDGKTNRWKVENSWSKKSGNEGFYIMSSEWFDEYNYQIVINKRYLTAELRNALESEVTELEPWDPMGSLALTK